MIGNVVRKIGYILISGLFFAAVIAFSCLVINNQMHVCASSLILDKGAGCHIFPYLLLGIYFYVIPFYFLYKYLGNKILGTVSTWCRDVAEVTFFLLLCMLFVYVGNFIGILLLTGYVVVDCFILVWPFYGLALIWQFITRLKINMFLKGLLLLLSAYVFVFIANTFMIYLL